ncbi:mitochondrial ribosomal protein S5 [Megachile rotundata]|uniref:mitochondrial ribosomal protein S5 n=1 Tax=Megachile rotundata TaxID=143995 RepID=UPI00061508A9|nr:PREDICTED: 28S ribosomal protein S5, mitochondrial [Megachile rotundata]
MTSGIFRVCRLITTCTRSKFITDNGLLIPRNPLIQNARSTTSFFMKRTAAELWKSVTSVSNAGRRRGRGRSAPRVKDLNKGQKMGKGKVPLVLPGLNAPVLKGNVIVTNERVSSPVQAEEEKPTNWNMSKKPKRNPLKRGWTGGLMGGRTLGPPDPVNGEIFENFESWILYHKSVSVMTSNMGRNKACRCLVITGNRNGLAGFSMLSGGNVKPSLITAKNRAGQRLMSIARYNEHTVMHDFFTQFGKTKIYVERKPKGHGLVCHRVIKTCCEAIGIKDIYAKIEGSKNVPNIVKAFFLGLIQQKTFQEIADEKQLHLVEFSKETGYFPKVLASPATARKQSEISPDETLNLRQHLMNGRIYLHKKPYVPFYTKLRSWSNHLRKAERQRGQYDVIIRSKAETGNVCSFLVDKYPEAQGSKWKKHAAKEANEQV